MSVVVPTHERPEALAICLQALAAQKTPHEPQVIVVHDGPASPATRAVAAAVTLLETERQCGPATARNLGVRNATGFFVLFTDDDCAPAGDWAAQLVQSLERGARVVAGRTVSDNSTFARATQAITDALMVPDPEGSLTFAPTMNLGCERDLLVEVPFDESFADAAGEDRAWCARVRERRIAIVPCESALVDHRPTLTGPGFVRQHLRYGRGARRLRASLDVPLGSPRLYTRILRTGFAAGPLVGALVIVAQAATAAGVAGQRLSEIRRSGARPVP
ncbi:MAG: glycosyltransferase [Actinobacteria bacterium]|nr:glycosyltransferase [Actinomycetota bacterium]